MTIDQEIAEILSIRDFWFLPRHGDNGRAFEVREAVDMAVSALRAQQEAEKNVVEVCPHCGTEIEMRWDIDAQGYKAFCPVCGNRLMLCDECQHRACGDYRGNCDYDSESDSCKFNRRPPVREGA